MIQIEVPLNAWTELKQLTRPLQRQGRGLFEYLDFFQKDVIPEEPKKARFDCGKLAHIWHPDSWEIPARHDAYLGRKERYITRPTGWLDGISLPRKTAGRKVVRTELEPSQTLGFIQRLKEPYSTLVMFFGLCGRRQEEAFAIKGTDLDDNNVLHIRRIIYNGRVEELAEEEQRILPLDQPEHAELVRRIRALGKVHEWVFHSRKGTPINPGNVRRRYLHPAAAALGIKIGGWHDFRHTLIRKMRRAGVHPVVVSAVVGHKRVELALRFTTEQRSMKSARRSVS